MPQTISETRIEIERRLAAEQEAVRSRQQVLLRQLDKKFGPLPPQVARRVNTTTSVAQLHEWLDRVIYAEFLEDVGFSLIGDVLLVTRFPKWGESNELRETQKSLVSMLVIRFMKVPAKVVRRIEATSDIRQLHQWQYQVFHSRKLADVGIPPLG